MSFPKPESFEKGSKLQKWLDWLSAGRVVGFIGGDISEQDDGVLLSAQQATAQVNPFEVTVFLDGSTWKASMATGTIFNLQAGGGSVTIAAATITITPGAVTNYFYLQCTVNDFSATQGNVTAAVFTHSGTTPPDTGGASTSTQLALATAPEFDGGVGGVTQYVRDNQSYQRARNWFESPAVYQHIFGPY